MKQYIDEYLSNSGLGKISQKNERSRLGKHGGAVLDNPADFYLRVSGQMSVYSIKTTISRLGVFYEFLRKNHKISPTATNPWKDFLEAHDRLFRTAYKPGSAKVTFEEARERIEARLEEPYKTTALLMLEGGLAFNELKYFDGKSIRGGSKPREVNVRDELRKRVNPSYSAFYTRVKNLGFEPHALIKLWKKNLKK